MEQIDRLFWPTCTLISFDVDSSRMAHSSGGAVRNNSEKDGLEHSRHLSTEQDSDNQFREWWRLHGQASRRIFFASKLGSEEHLNFLRLMAKISKRISMQNQNGSNSGKHRTEIFFQMFRVESHRDRGCRKRHENTVWIFGRMSQAAGKRRVVCKTGSNMQHWADAKFS